MAKKQRIKNEDPSINFRLSPELKKWITNEAISENKTVSNYLRDHLTSFKDGSLYKNEIAAYKSNSFMNSTEFLQLVVWVYKKREEYSYEEKDAIWQDKYIHTIKSIGNQLPDELVNEFDKVLLDLMKVKNEAGSSKSYTFCRSGYLYSDGFNYSLFEDYILKYKIEKHTVYVERG